MNNVGEKVVDDAQQRCGQVGGDLPRPVTAQRHRLEEPGRRCDVASLRHVHINDLAVLVDRPVHVPPNASDLDIGLINEPAVADTVTARPSGVDE
jgi:hypothetical protein